MILRELSLVIVITMVVFAAGIGWVSAKFFGDDNSIEEECEEHIEKTTGMDIDLTPHTLEQNK